MKSNRVRYTTVSGRRAKRSRLLFAGVGMALLLLGGYSIASFEKDTSTPLIETISSRLTLAEGAKLAWPSVGQAAVGSVEDGLLARSSDNEEPRPTASMAKVITALAVMENQPFELGQTGQTYTLTYEDVANYNAHAAQDGSVMPVQEGMVLTQYQAMQAMLIASGNNIADTLAEKTFGSQQAYVSYAQAMLQRMGLDQTVVADASGFSSATVSTPSELVAIGIAALKNPVIAEIVSQPRAWIPGVGVIENTNELLGTDGVFGIKTGTTDAAGNCLLFAAHYITHDGQKVTFVGVIMGGKNAISLYGDSKKLLASAKQGYSLASVQPESNVAEPPPGYSDQAPRR